VEADDALMRGIPWLDAATVTEVRCGAMRPLFWFIQPQIEGSIDRVGLVVAKSNT
jgi:uncharacterized protein (DUF1810 family)